MPSHPTCPWKPVVEPSRLIGPADPIASARLPSNACDPCCQLRARSMTPDGKIIFDGCAITGILMTLTQLNGLIAVGLKLNGAVEQTPAEAKPS